jgi:hypothetical protein
MSGMTKRLIAYVAVAIAITVAAYAATSWFSAEGPSASDTPAAGPRKDAPPPPRTIAKAGEGAPAETVPGVVVAEVVGTVVRSTAKGERTAVVEGATLGVDDALVTEAASRVRLKVGARSTVDLSENAQVQVRELSETMQRLGLVYGRAMVDYREDGGRVLRIENQDGSAVAKVEAGKFSILSTGTTVAVATETGQVDLTAAGSTVTVGANRLSIVSGGAPQRPLAIPAELVLRVVDPGCRVQREAFFTVSGRTAPGSRVTINEKAARVRGDGDFSLRVPLKIGRNRIVVVTEDVAGRVESRVIPCITVDPRASIEDVNIKWGGAADKRGGG